MKGSRLTSPTVLGPMAAVFVFIVNFLTMPADIYPGDPNASRKEAIQLINTGRPGIPFESRDSLGELAAERGQYFFENDAKRLLYSKYGFLNSLLYIPPLLAEKFYSGSLPLSGTTLSQLFFLNLYNLILSLVLFGLLWAIAARWTRSPSVVLVFVLSVFYGTFLWNYLRAQTTELFQAVFFTAFFFHFQKFLDFDDRNSLLWAMAEAGALTLCKFYFGILFPLTAVFIALTRRGRPGRNSALITVGAAALSTLAVFMAVNYFKFGAPLNIGYGQWRPGGERFERAGFAVLPAALWGFLFSFQRGIFWHFPPFILALAAWRLADRLRPEPCRFIAAAFLTFLFGFSLVSHWAGEASYGPRYMLFILPIASLPAILAVEWMKRHWHEWRGRAAAAAASAALIGSIVLQMQVNALPFMIYYQLAGPFRSYRISGIDDYFSRRHFGLINRDIRRFLDRKSTFPPVDILLRTLPEDARAAEALALESKIRGRARRNYFFAAGLPE